MQEAIVGRSTEEEIVPVALLVGVTLTRCASLGAWYTYRGVCSATANADLICSDSIASS